MFQGSSGEWLGMFIAPIKSSQINVRSEETEEAKKFVSQFDKGSLRDVFRLLSVECLHLIY